MKLTPVLLVAAVLGAAGFASYNNEHAATPEAPVVPQAQAAAQADLPPAAAAGDQALPPNHPAIDQSASSAHGNDFAPASDEPASLSWKAPPAWPSLPNPSSMRLATHKVPRAAGDSDDAELSVSRAGGETEANIRRWVGMFDGAKEQRRDKTVRGLKIAVVEIEGDFQGGMGAQSAPHKGWAMLGAIVQPSRGQPYFFKVTGPAATVKGARAAFDAMLDGITPSS